MWWRDANNNLSRICAEGQRARKNQSNKSVKRHNTLSSS
jgi:hypothetical protein